MKVRDYFVLPTMISLFTLPVHLVWAAIICFPIYYVLNIDEMFISLMLSNTINGFFKEIIFTFWLSCLWCSTLNNGVSFRFTRRLFGPAIGFATGLMGVIFLVKIVHTAIFSLCIHEFFEATESYLLMGFYSYGLFVFKLILTLVCAFIIFKCVEPYFNQRITSVEQENNPQVICKINRVILGIVPGFIVVTFLANFNGYWMNLMLPKHGFYLTMLGSLAILVTAFIFSVLVIYWFTRLQVPAFLKRVEIKRIIVAGFIPVLFPLLVGAVVIGLLNFYDIFEQYSYYSFGELFMLFSDPVMIVGFLIILHFIITAFSIQISFRKSYINESANKIFT